MHVMCALVVGATSVAAAHAENCKDASTQGEMNRCADQAFRKADSNLNVLYAQIMARLESDEATKGLLKKSQRLWLGFRDAECAFQTSASLAGSVYPMILSMCEQGLTEKRVSDFKAYLNCEEGDLSCPVPRP